VPEVGLAFLLRERGGTRACLRNRVREDGRRVESLDDQPDGKRQLPQEDRDRRDARPQGAQLVEAEQDCRGGFVVAQLEAAMGP
jgi:hypothetical protein